MGDCLPGTVVVKTCHNRRVNKDKNTAGHETMDEIIKMKDNVCVGPFQVEILKGRVE